MIVKYNISPFQLGSTLLNLSLDRLPGGYAIKAEWKSGTPGHYHRHVDRSEVLRQMIAYMLAGYPVTMPEEGDYEPL